MPKDPFLVNNKETFQLKPSLLLYPSQYTLSARWSTIKLLKFPYINIPAPKATGSVALPICKNNDITSSNTIVLQSDKNLPLSYSVYMKLRSYLKVPVLFAETNELNSVEETKTNSTSDIPLVSREEVMEYIANETGKDRLRDFYRKDVQERRHPDYEELVLTALSAGCLGIFIGFPLGYRKTSNTFIEENHATTFRSKMSYERMRIDKSVLGGMKSAAGGCIFMGFFITSLWGVSKCISIYRNKTSFVEYSIAASIIGAAFRLHLGPKGMVAGGIVGLTLGTIGGVVLMTTAKVTGETQEEKHYRYIEKKLAMKK
ncbi:RPII140-upstream gene protein-like isoform X2 [Ylistrum balloti]|nr:RPII140-upstream gene protein-like isoform X2 [Ylistrum balloti]